MSLVFGVTGDRVDLGSPSVLDDQTPFTVVALVYPTALTNDKYIWSKDNSGGTGRRFKQDGSSGAMNWRVKRSTNTNYIAATSTNVINTHQIFIATYDGALDPSSHIYRGTQASAVAEVSYTTTTAGSGSTSDAAIGTHIGNDSTGSKFYVGEISLVALFDKVLSTTEMNTIRTMSLAQAQAWSTTPLVTGCIGFWLCDDATTLNDLSGQGNDGTVFGATVGTNDWWAQSTHTRTVNSAAVVKKTTTASLGVSAVVDSPLATSGLINSVGLIDVDGEFSVNISGDVTTLLSLGVSLFAGQEEMGTVMSASYDGTADTIAVVRLTPLRTAINTYWVGRAAGIGVLREVARIQRVGQAALVTWHDTAVRAGQPYEYILQAYGLFDPTLLGPLSDVQYVRAGDATPPDSISMLATYPKVINNLAIAKFSTPIDEDYAGVHVVWEEAAASGTATSATTLTLVDTGAAFTGLSGYIVRIVAGTGLGQERIIAFTSATTITVDSPWDVQPNTTSQYEVYRLIKVVTDYGVPASDDEFMFTPLGYGRHYFMAFDRAGNTQDVSTAHSWNFIAGSETFVGPNHPPALTISQLPTATQQQLVAPYSNATQYAVVEVLGTDPIDDTVGVTIEYRTRLFYGSVVSSATSNTLTVAGAPWSGNEWKNFILTITSGTGAGQSVTVLSNTTNVLTIVGTFTTVPNNTSVFELAWVTGLLSTAPAGPAPDSPGSTRSRWIAVSKDASQNWLQLRAVDAEGLYSGVMTFTPDYDIQPGLSAVNPSIDSIRDTLTITGTVDDDARSLIWTVDGTPYMIPNLDVLKTFVLDEPARTGISLTDGVRRIITITPYSNIDGTGVAGPPWISEFSRPPRTLVSFENRDNTGQISNSVVKATLAISPSVTDVAAPAGSGTSSGSNTSYVLNDTAKQSTTGTASGTQTATTLAVAGTPWTTNQWAGYWVTLTGGTGADQVRLIISNTSNTLTVDAWVTTPVAASTTFAIGRWAKGMFAPNANTNTVYYVRITGGVGVNQIAKISDNSPTQLILSTPWDYTTSFAIPTTSTYQIQAGGTNWRLAPVTDTGGGSGAEFFPTLVPVYNTRSASGDYFEYYSEISGISPEAVRRAFLDADSVPSVSQVTVEEISANKLTVTIGSFDDDCKEWMLYARKSGVPTYDTVAVTGTATGSQSATTLKDTSKTWGTNQWTDYYVVTTGGTGVGQARLILSNTVDTLTISSGSTNWTVTPVAASTTYAITRIDGQLDDQYLRLDTTVNVSSVEFDAGTGVWYVIVIPKDSYNSQGERVFVVGNVTGTGTSAGQLTNVSVVRNDNPGVAAYNKLQWNHNAVVNSPDTTWTVKVYAYRSDLGSASRTEFTSPATRYPRLDAAPIASGNFNNADDTDAVAGTGSILHAVATRSTQALGVQYTWIYQVELYQSGLLKSSYQTQHSDWYQRPIPAFTGSPTITTVNSGSCSLTPDSKGNYYPNPPYTLKVAWALTAGTQNDAEYYINILQATTQTPISNDFQPIGAVPTTTTQLYDYTDVASDGTLNAGTKYRTYKIQITKISDNSVIATQTTSTTSFSAGRCEAP
jgi:hypothetical protein